MKRCPNLAVAQFHRGRMGVMSVEMVAATSVIAVVCGALMMLARQAISNVIDAIFFLVGCPWI